MFSFPCWIDPSSEQCGERWMKHLTFCPHHHSCAFLTWISLLQLISSPLIHLQSLSPTHKHNVCLSQLCWVGRKSCHCCPVMRLKGQRQREVEAGYQCDQCHHLHKKRDFTVVRKKEAKGSHYANPLWSNHSAKPTVLYLANSKP